MLVAGCSGDWKPGDLAVAIFVSIVQVLLITCDSPMCANVVASVKVFTCNRLHVNLIMAST